MNVEAGQLARVAELAGQHGLLWHHCRDGRGCNGTPGLPDLIIVGPRGLMLRELKTSTTNESRAQTTWRLMLCAAGVDVGLWLPSHFRDDTVEIQIAALG